MSTAPDTRHRRLTSVLFGSGEAHGRRSKEHPTSGSQANRGKVSPGQRSAHGLSPNPNRVGPTSPAKERGSCYVMTQTFSFTCEKIFKAELAPSGVSPGTKCLVRPCRKLPHQAIPFSGHIVRPKESSEGRLKLHTDERTRSPEPTGRFSRPKPLLRVQPCVCFLSRGTDLKDTSRARKAHLLVYTCSGESWFVHKCHSLVETSTREHLATRSGVTRNT